MGIQNFLSTRYDGVTDQKFKLHLLLTGNAFMGRKSFLESIQDKVKKDHPDGDDKKIKILVNSAKSSRKMEAEDTPKIGRALRDYVNFGDKSYYLRRLTLDEIKKSKSTD